MVKIYQAKQRCKNIHNSLYRHVHTPDSGFVSQYDKLGQNTTIVAKPYDTSVTGIHSRSWSPSERVAVWAVCCGRVLCVYVRVLRLVVVTSAGVRVCVGVSRRAWVQCRWRLLRLRQDRGG